DILKRNMFCSTCPPILGGPPVVEESGPTGPTRTTMPIRLILTAVSAKDNRWSIAVMCETQTKECGAFGLGSKIKDGTVIDIKEKRVEVDVNNHTEYIDLDTGR